MTTPPVTATSRTTSNVYQLYFELWASKDCWLLSFAARMGSGSVCLTSNALTLPLNLGVKEESVWSLSAMNDSAAHSVQWLQTTWGSREESLQRNPHVAKISAGDEWMVTKPESPWPWTFKHTADTVKSDSTGIYYRENVTAGGTCPWSYCTHALHSALTPTGWGGWTSLDAVEKKEHLILSLITLLRLITFSVY